MRLNLTRLRTSGAARRSALRAPSFSFTAQLQVDLKSLLHGRRQPIGAAESIQPCELDVSVRVVNAYFMIYKRCSQA
jgi:hypothetical protein